MTIKADMEKGLLYAGDLIIPVSNRIRTVREGTRARYEVVRTIPDNLPYDPHPFPKGSWVITGVDWQKERGFDARTYGPVKIRTNAQCMVNIWELDGEGDYSRETERETVDGCYWLHYTEYSTTLGCIRIDSEKDAIRLGEMIQKVYETTEMIYLEVV